MEEKIRELIRDQLGLNEITNETPVLNHSNIEPFVGIEIVMRLEEELGLTIPDEDAEELVTVGDIIKYVKEKKPELFEAPKNEPKEKVVKVEVVEKPKEKVVEEKPLMVQCLVCEKEFDLNKQEKSSLGTVECPHCKATLSEEGKILGKPKETKEEK